MADPSVIVATAVCKGQSPLNTHLFLSRTKSLFKSVYFCLSPCAHHPENLPHYLCLFSVSLYLYQPVCLFVPVYLFIRLSNQYLLITSRSVNTPESFDPLAYRRQEPYCIVFSNAGPTQKMSHNPGRTVSPPFLK